MPNEFISPNWHVVLLHAPLGLLVVGLLIELISWISPRGGFRAAGRWMMLLGGLLAIPTATAGIYAFRDVVATTPVAIGQSWQEVLQQSRWLPGQWELIEQHIWYNSAAVALLVAVVILWLAGSDNWRRSAYIPLLILMLAGVGLLVIGAWHGGELVYRYGTGVDLSLSPDVAGQVPDQPAGTATAGPAGQVVAVQQDIRYYIPPLQLHTVLAGLAAAFIVGAFGLMIRRWQLDSEALVPLRPERVVAPAVTPVEPVTPAERVELRSRGQSGADVIRPKVYPGWFWLGGFLLAVGAAVAGAWSVMGVFTREAFEQNWEEIFEEDHRRLLLHVIFGESIIILSLVLAGLVRFARRWRVMAGLLGSLVILLIAGQVWLGTMMTFDGHTGPLLRFSSAASVPHEHDDHKAAPTTQPRESAEPVTPARPRDESGQPVREPVAPPPEEQPVAPAAPQPAAPPIVQEPVPSPAAPDAPAPAHEEIGDEQPAARRGQDVTQDEPVDEAAEPESGE